MDDDRVTDYRLEQLPPTPPADWEFEVVVRDPDGQVRMSLAFPTTENAAALSFAEVLKVVTRPTPYIVFSAPSERRPLWRRRP
jgi:hypothetical protein